MDSKTKINIWYIIAAFVVLSLLQSFYQASKQYTVIPYSQFQTLLDANKIDKVWVAQSKIRGVLKQPEKNGIRQFATTRVDPALAGELDKHKVTYFGEAPNTWLPDTLSWILPTLLFFGVWMFVVRRFAQQGGGMMAIGKRYPARWRKRAVLRIVAGLEKWNRLLIPKERRIVAYHELGHAIVAMSLPGEDPVHKISIIPRGIAALGYTIQRPTEDRFLMTQEELDNRMAVLLGGRAAELVFFHHLSTGAADDLVKATDTARSMVLRYGMDEKLSHVAYEREHRSMFAAHDLRCTHEREFSDETKRLIDHAVRGLVGHALERAVTAFGVVLRLVELTSN